MRSMKLRLVRLEITCRKTVVSLPLADFNYFYGEMGAGKSTIARLIDFCLGGGIEMTPALQSEFVAATLHLVANETAATIERGANANQVLATWGPEEAAQQLMLPARVPAGIVLPGTQVEVLSDFLFHLIGYNPPKIRRSRLKEDSDLQRLSFRDLFTYCYLDQDTIDSSFFHLEAGADQFRRLKSRAVLGFILGYNQERVAELDAELEEVRSDRADFMATAEALQESLHAAGVASEFDITQQLHTLEATRKEVRSRIATTREQLATQKSHVTDQLTKRARELVAEVDAIQTAIAGVEELVAQNRRHQNELLSLTTKFQRVTGARAVLNGVDFERCPRCTQHLDRHGVGICQVCGQPEPSDAEMVVTATESDLSGRMKELANIIEVQQHQLRNLRLREAKFREEKARLDGELGQAMAQYDSAYLSQALETERRAAAVTEEIRFLEKLRVLPARVEQLRASGDALATRESKLRRELKDARAAAEKDLTNLDRLKTLFLDCLIRAKIAGFAEDDQVTMASPGFVPQVLGVGTGEAAVTSFDTLGSGGKKTLFKCCFALAIHRLAQEVGALLPTLLIIDSPMKNISERENRQQFEGFHKLLYELADTELAGTQFIVIDKEYCPPEAGQVLNLVARHMTVEQAENPPLIPYYRERVSPPQAESAGDVAEQRTTDDSGEAPESSQGEE